MSQALTEIAKTLAESSKKVQLIYAFNNAGKTLLCQEFRRLIESAPASRGQPRLGEVTGARRRRILYYSSFTEDLFYWDSADPDAPSPKLKIRPNAFIPWLLGNLKQDQSIVENFRGHTGGKITPHFSKDYSDVAFSFEGAANPRTDSLKISKSEESGFIWNVFSALLKLAVSTRNDGAADDLHARELDELEYVFVDDPVSSLDENNLIELAVDLAAEIRSSVGLKFVVTTHSPLFYNVLSNELGKASRYRLSKAGDDGHRLEIQGDDSPFSYHLFLLAELKQACDSGRLHKYHFTLLRNVLEKTSNFLGYRNWTDLLTADSRRQPSAFENRLINVSSHSKFSGEETIHLSDEDEATLRDLVGRLIETFHFNVK